MKPCVPREDLERLLGDDLPAEQAGDIHEHLAGCVRCQEVVDRLSDDPDLRRWTAASRTPRPRLLDGAALARTLCRLRAAFPPDTPEPDGIPPSPRAALGFLAPPRQKGDLGALGPYRVLAELGRGGMGIVLLGYDPDLGRPVALKVLPPDQADDRARARFVREARAAAGVEHDHVVPVHAVANPPDGPPYLVMQLIDGPTLAARIRLERTLDPREAARIIRQVAEGLAAAHRAGLVHRDVKPANIILDVATGRAKITDFGLARAAAPAEGSSGDGSAPGTPEYMSPEQVQEPNRVDARTDIYSLGVTLYEALTGEVPFRGMPHLVLRQLVADEPRPPRRLNDTIPRELETICLKAMAKEPARRSCGCWPKNAAAWRKPTPARPGGTWRTPSGSRSGPRPTPAGPTSSAGSPSRTSGKLVRLYTSTSRS